MPKKKFLDDLERFSESDYSEYDIGLLGPDDSHFWGPPLKVERKKEEIRKESKKSLFKKLIERVKRI